MRNLKRALSLLLSSTMVLGMVAMGGSAAGYQDVDDTYNKEAIEVLQAVGIMTGDENGNFNPDKGVTRNEMAVIMSKLMAYNVATYSGTSPFTDVPDWAEPYVAACYTNGITAGTSDTTYGGNDTVTTAQAALMIMKALGYFQYQSDFGGDWQLSTVSQGNKIDLFEKVNSGVKDAMSRNDVAQLVLNGLEAGTVEAENNGSITVGDTTIVSGVKYNYVTSNQDYAKSIDTVKSTTDKTDATAYIVELGEKLYQGSLRKDETVSTGGALTYYTDVFGRPATRWEYQSKEIGVYADEADHAFSNKVTAKALYDAVGRTAAENYVWTITIDGNEVYQAEGFKALVNNKTDTVKEVIELTLGTGYDGTGNGVRTEVFVDAVNGYVHMSLTHYYAAEVYTVDKDNGVTTLADLGNGPAALDDEFDTTNFSEDQVVVYSYTQNEIQEVMAATSMEGTVTATRVETDDNNGDYYIVDGTKYNYNWSVPKTDRLETENVNNNMVGYLDQYGYAIYIDEAAISYDYAYVLSMGNDGDIYGGNADTYYARLVLTDGTVVKAETDEDDKSLENHIVSYTVDKNGVYSLSDRSNKTALAEITDINVDNGIAAFDINGTTYTANSSTVFIIGDSAKDPLDYNNYDFTAYTGVKNMPNITNGTNDKFVIATADNSNVAKVVYVQDADVSGAGSVYFVRANVGAKLTSDSELGRYREIDAVVDGEVTTLKVKEGTTAEEILCGGLANQVSTLTQLTPAQGLYLNDEGTQRILALESITTNADGLVTNVRLYDARNAQGDGFVNFYAEGTDKATKETVMLGGTEDGTPGTRYAWYDDVAVVRWDTYAGEFKVSTINSVKTDVNDRAVAVLADDVLNGLCIVEYKTGDKLPTIPQQDVKVDMEDANFAATFDGLTEGSTIANAQVGDPIQVVIKAAALKSRAAGDPVTTLEAGVQYSVKINGVDYGPYTVNENNELAFTYNLTAEDIAAGKVTINGVFTYVENPDAEQFQVTVPAEGVTVVNKADGSAITTGMVAKGTVITVTPAEGYTVKVNDVAITAVTDYTVDKTITITATKGEEPATPNDLPKATISGTTITVPYWTEDGKTDPTASDIQSKVSADLGINLVAVTGIGSTCKGYDAESKEYGITLTRNFKVLVNDTLVGYVVSTGATLEGVAQGVYVAKDATATDTASTVGADGKLTVSATVSKDVELVDAVEIAVDGTNVLNTGTGVQVQTADEFGSTTLTSVSATNKYVPVGAKLIITAEASTANEYHQLKANDVALTQEVLITDTTAQKASYVVDKAHADENGKITIKQDRGVKVVIDGTQLDGVYALSTGKITVDASLKGDYVAVSDTAAIADASVKVAAALVNEQVVYQATLPASGAVKGVLTLVPAVSIKVDTTSFANGTYSYGEIKDATLTAKDTEQWIAEGAVVSLKGKNNTEKQYITVTVGSAAAEEIKGEGCKDGTSGTPAEAVYTIPSTTEAIVFGVATRA